MPDFNSISQMKAEEIQKPLPPPGGWYLAMVVKPPEARKLTVQGVEQDVVDFDLKIIAPNKEVSDQQLADWQTKFGSISDMRPQQKTFFVDSPEGRFGMIQFMSETLGVDKTGKSVGQMLAESSGRQLLAQIIHKPYQSRATGQMELAANIGLTAKA